MNSELLLVVIPSTRGRPWGFFKTRFAFVLSDRA